MAAWLGGSICLTRELVALVQAPNSVYVCACVCVVGQFEVEISSGFCKNFEQNKIRLHSKFLQKPLDISTSNFYRMIDHSKSQSNLLLIVCDSTCFNFNKL